MQYILLGTARLHAKHKATGRTRHYHGSIELPAPASLQIVRFTGDSGFYLLYLDDLGKELTDTYFSDLSEALAQARWEFSLEPEDWAMET